MFRIWLRKLKEFFKRDVVKMTPIPSEPFEEIAKIVEKEEAEEDEVLMGIGFSEKKSKPKKEEILMKELSTNPEEDVVVIDEFEKETGKHAIWGGKITKQYLEWYGSHKS